MKQFWTIFKFELAGYFKNKIFIGVTVSMVAALVILIFIPNIVSLVKKDSGNHAEETMQDSDNENKSIMLISSEDDELSAMAQPAFASAFSDYQVKTLNEPVETIKQQILDGSAECVFVLDSASSYTYYVNNLSMYDQNASIADMLLEDIYRSSAMAKKGMTQQEISDILNVQIQGRVTALGADQMKNFFYTYIMIFALYMVIIVYGQMIANNVASEKSSRAMEVLVTSAKPNSMMFGKVFASCLAGLFQLTVIFGTALLLYRFNKSSWTGNEIMDSFFNIPPYLLIYMLIFFLLGFLIYAFLYGAVGSTVSKMEDINTSVMPVTMVFLVGFFVVIFAITSGEVDTPLVKVFSYLPFSSPMVMFARICMSTVPIFEIVLSVAILIASVILTGILSAKIYRAGVLMYGNKPSPRQILKVIHKA